MSGTGSLIRLYRQGDGKGTNDLFNLVFKKKRDLNTWNWKFDDCLNRDEHAIVVAESGGDIVGMYPSWGRYYKFGNDLILTVQPVEDCVHPGFRGGGRVFIQLHRGYKKRAIETGARFAIGFPTEDHFKIGGRLFGYRSLLSNPVLCKRLNYRLAIRSRFHNLFLERLAYLLSNRLYFLCYSRAAGKGEGRFKIEQVYSFDQRYDRLWERVSRRYGIIGVRDSAYLNWRYLQCPEGGYTIFSSVAGDEVQGYIVVKVLNTDRGEKAGIVVDLITEDEGDLIGGLLDRGILYFLKERVDYVKTFACDRVIYQYLMKRGFKEEGEPLHMAYELFDGNLDEVFLTDRGNWYLSYGDTDLVD